MGKASNLPLLVGNWKMNLNQEQIKTFFHQLLMRFPQGKSPSFAIAPQFVHIPLVLHLSQEMSFPLRLGAQNCGTASQGPYTGEVSPAALADLGVDFIIIGHSERRDHMGETSRMVRKKLKAAWENGLVAIVCVGEHEDDRNSGKEYEKVQTQIEEIFAPVADKTGKVPDKLEVPKHSYPLMIAYEPIWAIGTGKNATPAQAQQMHEFIRKTIKNVFPMQKNVPLLYGGSVTPGNVKELINMNDIDGVLVGGASMNATSWGEIIHIVNSVH